MQKTIMRYFDDNGTPKNEKIIWGLAGTEGISINDIRCVPIGETVDGIDLWLPMSISNPGFDVTAITPQYQMENIEYVDPITGLASIVQSPVKTLTFAPMDVYNVPLLPGYTEITMEDYNTLVGGGS